MTIEKMRQLHQARPFQPFIIHLADGRAIPVVSSEFLSFSPTGRTIIVHYGDDEFSIIDLLLVTELEVRSRQRQKKAK
jgi:hypothetical protein